MTIGYVYILTNPAMPDLAKVGKTVNDPQLRAGQLSSSTGVPDKFALFKAYKVTDCNAAEELSHRILERVFGRPNSNREFFSGKPHDISTILDDALASFTVRADTVSISSFREPLDRLNRKEFTFACLEFESIFSSLPLTKALLKNSEALQMAAGAYIASCIAISRAPYSPVVLDSAVKHEVSEHAIKFVEDFNGAPIAEVIRFVRSYA